MAKAEKKLWHFGYPLTSFPMALFNTLASVSTYLLHGPHGRQFLTVGKFHAWACRYYQEGGVKKIFRAVQGSWLQRCTFSHYKA
jgi:hypothetical protein